MKETDESAREEREETRRN